MTGTNHVRQGKSQGLTNMSAILLSIALILSTSHYGFVNADAM